MPIEKSLLTPKELAEAIGASESSLRRWVDGGDIRMSRTAGGHRRIPLAEAVRFVRAIGATVVRPDTWASETSGSRGRNSRDFRTMTSCLSPSAKATRTPRGGWSSHGIWRGAA